MPVCWAARWSILTSAKRLLAQDCRYTPAKLVERVGLECSIYVIETTRIPTNAPRLLTGGLQVRVLPEEPFFVLWPLNLAGSQNDSTARTEADAAEAFLFAIAAQDHLVAIFEKLSLFSAGQGKWLLATSG
jgi:hypothetical protein